MVPLVSIIIPNYNHADFLKERIESVIHQTYSNFEIIILDDASDDYSKTITDLYQTHIKVTNTIYNAANSGTPFLQWKKGIELARGKYIWIAESDDAAKSNFLELLVPFLEHDYNIKFVYADSERDEAAWRTHILSENKTAKIFEGQDFVRKNMLNNPAIVNASAVLFRKDAIQDQLLKQAGQYKTAFDWLCWCNIALQGKIAFLPLKLNFFRQHKQNTSLKAVKNGLFISEGFRIVGNLKQQYHIHLNFIHMKVWASVWAQTCLITKIGSIIFFKNWKQAWKISPLIVILFFYYLLKFGLFSPVNIRIETTNN